MSIGGQSLNVTAFGSDAQLLMVPLPVQDDYFSLDLMWETIVTSQCHTVGT